MKENIIIGNNEHFRDNSIDMHLQHVIWSCGKSEYVVGIKICDLSNQNSKQPQTQLQFDWNLASEFENKKQSTKYQTTWEFSL